MYGGARYKFNDMWSLDMTKEYFQIIRDHKDQIIIEVGAHDHIASLRYHSSKNVMDLPDPSVAYDFHNLLVAPAVTPNKNQNPGIAMFEVDNGIPHSLKYEFLDLNPTFGSTNVPANLTFMSLDFAAQYGVTQIDATSLAAFRKRIEADVKLAHDYMVRQVGFNPADSVEYAQAMAIYSDEKLVTSSGDVTAFLCEMHKSISGTEESACASGNSIEYLGMFLQ